MTRSLDGTILTPAGWVAGRVKFEAGIACVTGEPANRPTAPFVLPGFVDLHVHGGGGADVMAGADAIRSAARAHARHGTTSFCPTSVTAPDAAIADFLDSLSEAATGPAPDMARILGAHLEGPFLNPAKLGAQPPFARPADPVRLRDWAVRARVRVMTFAPEMDPDGALLATLRPLGIRPQLGHTLCDYASARAHLETGCGVTHLFNAMSPLGHRGNGAAGAALAHAERAEIIPDLLHVEPGAILAARRAIPDLYGVTDATAGAGAPDGRYRLGSIEVIKAGGAMRLDDGTLAGSALTMDQALRNLVAIGLPLDEASRRLSSIPADWIGDPLIGRIRPGAHADLLVFDADLSLRQVVIGGADVPLDAN